MVPLYNLAARNLKAVQLPFKVLLFWTDLNRTMKKIKLYSVRVNNIFWGVGLSFKVKQIHAQVLTWLTFTVSITTSDKQFRNTCSKNEHWEKGNEACLYLPHFYMFETSDIVAKNLLSSTPAVGKVYFVISTEMGPPVKKLNIQNHTIAEDIILYLQGRHCST